MSFKSFYLVLLVAFAMPLWSLAGEAETLQEGAVISSSESKANLKTSKAIPVAETDTGNCDFTLPCNAKTRCPNDRPVCAQQGDKFVCCQVDPYEGVKAKKASP